MMQGEKSNDAIFSKSALFSKVHELRGSGVSELAFPTGQDSETFRDNGTEVPSLSRDNGTRLPLLFLNNNDLVFLHSAIFKKQVAQFSKTRVLDF